MRIAMVSDAVYPYNKGGKETRLYEISTRLAAAGHDVHIYTMAWGNLQKDRPSREANGVHLHAISRLYPLYSGERRSIKQGLLFSFACFKLLKEQFDVVDVDHMPYFPLFSMRIVCWLKRRPMVATWHEVWGREYWKQYLGGPAGLVAAGLEWLTGKLPDKIVAVSSLTAGRLHSVLHARPRVSVVPGGLNLQAIHVVKPLDKGVDILFAGRLLAHKHVDVLLQAVALLKQQRPQVTCGIIGEGPEREALEALSVRLGLQSNVRFYGFLPESGDLYAHMKAAGVFVSPSSREGFGQTVAEAQACGTPVVTVDAPDNAAQRLVTPASGRVCELAPAALADAIQDMLTHRPNSTQVRDAVRAHDWGTAAVAVAEVYQS